MSLASYNNISIHGEQGNIFKEQKTFPEECWVGVFGPYMYIADTLENLFILMYSEWKQERHLV